MPHCKCEDCVEKVQNRKTPTGSETEEAEPESAFNIPDCFVGKKTLQENLFDYKDSLSPDVLLVGNDLSTGFSDEVIEQILKVCDVVNTAKYIMDKVDLWEEKQALYVLSLIQQLRNTRLD